MTASDRAHEARAHPSRGASGLGHARANRFLLIVREGPAGALAASAEELAAEVALRGWGEPDFVHIAHAFLTLDDTKRAIDAVCRAPVAVFDCEQFEPGIMFLIAIRGAVRSGVSLLVNAFPPATGPGFIPYSLQCVAFANALAKAPEGLAQRLARLACDSLLEQERDPEYRDLPAYEALRRRAGLVPEQRDETLVLCPYAAPYSEVCWMPTLGPMLASVGKLRRLGEHTSARLASDIFHVRLRDHPRCIADWTCLRPDLFYELGVRIATRRGGILHVMADGASWYPPASVPHTDTRLGRWPCPTWQAAIAKHNAALTHTQDLLALFSPVRYAIGSRRAPLLEDALSKWIGSRDEGHGVEGALNRVISSGTPEGGAAS